MSGTCSWCGDVFTHHGRSANDCGRCDTVTADEDDPTPCPECEDGMVEVDRDEMGTHVTAMQPCQACHGTGVRL